LLKCQVARIKIEELLKQLDAGVAALKRAQANLKRYRQSVLQAACGGRLVAHDPSNDPAEWLLQKILTSRKREWELDSKNKVIYSQPMQPQDIQELPKLPEGWTWATLEQITSPTRVICYGILMPKDDVPDGVPYVKVKNIQNSKVDVSGLSRTSSEIAKQYARASLKNGDLLLAIRGTYGRVAVVPPELEGGNITQDTARLAVNDLVDRDYIAWYLHSRFAQIYFERVARGVAVKGINIADVRLCPVPLPPLEEQKKIVAEVKQRLFIIVDIETAVCTALSRAKRLRQNILHQAFSGQLLS